MYTVQRLYICFYFMPCACAGICQTLAILPDYSIPSLVAQTSVRRYRRFEDLVLRRTLQPLQQKNGMSFVPKIITTSYFIIIFFHIMLHDNILNYNYAYCKSKQCLMLRDNFIPHFILYNDYVTNPAHAKGTRIIQGAILDLSVNCGILTCIMSEV